MDKEINVLILSCGTRNKIVRAFKNELGNDGKVFATDSSKLAPALYEADGHFIVPRIDEPNYLNHLLDICQANNITGIFSLIDPELLLLAKNKEKFLDIGTIPIISDYQLIETSFNKYAFNEYLKTNGFNATKCYMDLESFYEAYENKKIDFPIFVKPVEGSASVNINKVYSKEELELLFSMYDDLMIQEFMDGVEYGVDAYIDLHSEEIVSVFIKEKIKMRAGETDKAVSVKDKELLSIVLRFIETAGYLGIIDMDIFKVDGKYYIAEVNPRFGGGYPHGYEAGVNIPRQIINNLRQIQNDVELNNYDPGIYMMKYNEVLIIKREDII